MEEIWRLSAIEALAELRAGTISSEQLVSACLDRITAIDRRLRAFITISAETALTESRNSDVRRHQRRDLRALEGLPVAIKDLTRTADIRTTFGSELFADHVPREDEICVARLKAAGAIILGKTNTPEFGFGPRTTNALYGPTANPYDERLSSGGSSGGAAVAVAAGMAPLAQGTDFGGSVRTPASFCGVVGLRPTPGRIPVAGKLFAWNGLSTDGVLARTVGDAALMLSAMAGRDDRDPISSHCAPPIGGDGELAESGIRVACSPDLGVAPVAADVRALFAEAIGKIGTMCRVEEAVPDCTEAPAAFATLRGAMIHRQFADLIQGDRTKLTGPLIWNIKQGEEISADAYLAAEEARSRVYARFVDFFREWDFLLTPSAAVLPFANTLEEVLDIDDTPLASPIEYLSITFIISLVGLPCISVPAAWTDGGLPFGLQIIAPPFQEARLVTFAAFLEKELGFRHRWQQ